MNWTPLQQALNRIICGWMIPAGALLAANPRLFLAVKPRHELTKQDWHAFYDRCEQNRRRISAI